MIFIGFILSLIILVYLTAALGFAGFHGGEEFSSVGFKNMWWYAPLACFIGWLWYLLFVYAPFTLTVNI